ncbi:MFS transporter [Nocardioides sp. WG-D5]|uniref:MFS transporter n=1 Tax=Nocardioides luteus TaxID=1844 RepID=UPI000202899F|nr:MFS transporter [Nocardioides luteus]EGD44083.1 putative major facilitator superfamily (MFS) transporter [Nocardioidaceae bacterium Broad-1]MBG6095795.1 DHA1 family inner membrane transport protein [Nocardioides luteus]
MHEQAYNAQCRAAENRHPAQASRQRDALILFALALGTFAIGSGEFGSNGIVQLFAADLGASVPTATNAITAYALGVVIGSPVLTIAAARLNRRTLLLGLVVLFIVGNLLSAAASGLGVLIVARFITGTVQGAYFGAGAVVAAYAYGPGKGGKAFATVMAGLTIATIFGSPLGTFIGQQVGWQALYVVVSVVGLLAGIAIWVFVPRTSALAGGSVMQELGALRRPMVWATTAIAALGISSIFAVYTFIGPYITDAVAVDEAWIPVALAVFGVGMALGNWIGGRLADQYEYRGLVLGYAVALAFLAVIAVGGENLAVLLPCLLGVGASTMMAIPTIQVLLTRYAPEAPTLMGAVNLASLNLANALGAIGGALVLNAGWGALSTAWAGLVLTAAGLLLFAVTVPRVAPPQPLAAVSATA